MFVYFALGDGEWELNYDKIHGRRGDTGSSATTIGRRSDVNMFFSFVGVFMLERGAGRRVYGGEYAQ